MTAKREQEESKQVETERFVMNLPGVKKKQVPPIQPTAMLDPAISSPILWHQAQSFLAEIENHLRLAPDNGAHDTALRLLVERMPANFMALQRAYEEQVGQVAESTAELAETNAVLKKQIAEIAQSQRRLAAEHAVARILAESASLTDAIPRILHNISQSLGWDVGVLWILDRDSEVLRCMDVWHAPEIDIPAFERASRQCTFARGIGLPGRVWDGDCPVWIPDLIEEANCPEAPIAAREGLHAAVGFPIGNGEFLGVMEFFSLEIRQPDEEPLQMMISIGSHISQFMERLNAEKALFLKEAELGVAQKIQQGLVAKVPPTLGDFDIAGTSHSAVETGGDYFDFFPLLDSCQGIVIADASGHGLGPALLITETRAYLRAFALTSPDIGRIVALLNRRLVEDLGYDNFVTLFLARLDPRTRSFLYTSAGHPGGCILDGSGRVKALLKSTGPPLGIMADGAFPTAAAIALQASDLVLLLTDGLVEARAPDGTAFGVQRAIDVVRVYRRETAAQIVDNLYHAVRAFSHNHPQVDDITAVVIKVREFPDGIPSLGPLQSNHAEDNHFESHSSFPEHRA
jgi:serine phosphatase RsbU (regulator of sigma subunit)